MLPVIVLLTDLQKHQLSVVWQSKWQIDSEKLLKNKKRNRKYHTAGV